MKTNGKTNQRPVIYEFIYFMPQNIKIRIFIKLALYGKDTRVIFTKKKTDSCLSQ